MAAPAVTAPQIYAETLPRWSSRSPFDGSISGARTAATEIAGNRRAKLQKSAAHRFIRYVDAALGDLCDRRARKADRRDLLGTPAERVKDCMWELDRREKELKAILAGDDEDPIRLHPEKASIYRRQVAGLIDALNDEEARLQAAEVIRGLVEAIVFTPDPAGEALTIDPHGALAGRLALASDSK